MRRLAAVLVCLSTLSAGGQASAQAVLRIATEGAYPPFNFVENDEPAGFEVELGRALCVAMGLPCVFVLQSWDEMYGGLKSDRYDAIMSSMQITPERRTRYRFSKPYYRIPSGLIGRKNEPVPTDAAALAGRTVGVVVDSEQATYLENLPHPPEIRRYSKLEEAELDLLTDRIDFVLGDRLAELRFLDGRDGQTCCRHLADLPVDRGPGVAVAMRKGDRGLAEMFNAAIDTVEADGTYERIRAKYFPFSIR